MEVKRIASKTNSVRRVRKGVNEREKGADPLDRDYGSTALRRSKAGIKSRLKRTPPPWLGGGGGKKGTGAFLASV